ncbi:MAG: hypothetical protein R3B70_48470, partial [Polyangiaceae bacterium]
MINLSSATMRAGSILLLAGLAGCVDASGGGARESDEIGESELGITLVEESTERVSVSSGGGQALLGASVTPQISRNGRFVVFASDASNLVAGDNNDRQDVFLHDRVTGQTERVSVADNEAEANGDSFEPVVSEDGRFVAFTSLAGNLLTGVTLTTQQVYLRDRQLGTTQILSTPTVGLPNGSSRAPSMAA